LIVETAKIFQENNTNVKFILIGDGPLKETLNAKILKYNLKNVEILEYQKKENLFKIISECDLGLITYEINDTFRKNIPSKIFDYMFLEKPVLINLEGEASKMISSGSFGFELETNDPKEFYLKISEIISNRIELKTRGINGFNFLKENFDKKILLEKLNKIIE
jgi:glycosyltransferase involved in cell wall biosynthesis